MAPSHWALESQPHDVPPGCVLLAAAHGMGAARGVCILGSKTFPGKLGFRVQCWRASQIKGV